MSNDTKNSIYEFDRFRIDSEKLMLYFDQAEVSIPPKMVRTLVVLVESRGKILSKDELIDRIWSDTIVEESNLSQHLHHLRKVLGDSPDGRPYIETLRRRGYRFNGDVRMLDKSDSNVPIGVPSTIPAVGFGVERSGNVLRLVDWHAAPETEPQVVATMPDEIPSRGTYAARWRISTAVAIMASIAVVGAAFALYRTDFYNSRAELGSELSLTRLTSGIKPTNAAISHDGAYFVYDELSDEGSRLWLQQVGQTGRVEIAPASRMAYLGKTFTPDGKYIYFTAIDGEGAEPSLYRVAAIGGPQTKLADGVMQPVSFSPDGREMVFVRVNRQARSTELVVADTDAGNQRTLLSREAPSEIVGSPAWSPDGGTIVFAVINAEGTVSSGPVGIFSISPDGGPIRKVTQERWDNVYRIAWTFNGEGLVAVATREGDGHSARRNQIYFLSYPSGESRRLTTDGSWHEEWSLGVTKDNAILAVPFNRSSQIWTMDAEGDSASAVQITHGLGDGRAGLAPIPDGRVGFIARTGDLLDIWLMNADGSGRHQLTSGPHVIEELRADPHGRFFVFSSFKDGHSHLYRVGADGRDAKQLTSGDKFEVDSTISHDGNWIVYESASANVASKLYRISVDGGEPHPFGDNTCGTPNYSPSGDLLSCIRGSEIVVLSAADGTQVNSFKILPYTRINFGARWTPDGRGLVYIRTEKGFSNLWIQPLDDGKPRQLTNFASGDIHNYAYSIDGTKLFVARGHQIHDAILITNFL